MCKILSPAPTHKVIGLIPQVDGLYSLTAQTPQQMCVAQQPSPKPSATHSPTTPQVHVQQQAHIVHGEVEPYSMPSRAMPEHTPMPSKVQVHELGAKVYTYKLDAGKLEA